MKSRWIVLLALLATGCGSSRGFDRGALSERLQGSLPVVTDEDVQKALDLKPQLPSPFTLAICFQEPEPFGKSEEYPYNTPHPLWRGEDRDRFLALTQDLREKNVVSSAFIIPTVDVTADLKAIRLSAAQHSADAVLVIAAATDVDKYSNPWGAGYFLILPLAVLPGSEVDALVMARATLWDVRNEYLYLSAEAEGTAHQKRPLMFIRKTQATAKAKAVALDNLAAELAQRLDRVLAAAKTP